MQEDVMFGRKKMSKEEAEHLRNLRIGETADKLRVQLVNFERQKNSLVVKVVEARKKDLTNQEAQARSLLKRCMAAERRANGMLMTLELAVQSRDLASLNSQFLESIGSLSQDIDISAGKNNSKKVTKKYLRAMYKADKQNRALDDMLDAGDYASAISAEGESYAEFDSEVDSLVKEMESKSGSAGRNANSARRI